MVGTTPFGNAKVAVLVEEPSVCAAEDGNPVYTVYYNQLVSFWGHFAISVGSQVKGFKLMKKKSTRATHEFIIKLTNIGGQSPEQFDIGGGGDGAARRGKAKVMH